MDPMTAIQVGTAVSGMLGGKRQRSSARNAAQQALQERQEQQERVDTEIENYKNIKFTNPYEGMENPYAENVYEDLTVNQQQAQFQAQQGAQQRANIMQSLRGAAGSSGIAGLAQSLANQGQLQAQQISSSIGMQEARNQQLAAGGAQQKQAGAAAVDLQQRKGDAMLQEAESGRQATILGIQFGQGAGANKNYQQQLLNQENANISANQMTMGGIQGLAGIDWSSFGGNTTVPSINTTNSLGSGDVNNPPPGAINVPGASANDYTGGFGKTFNPLTGRYE